MNNKKNRFEYLLSRHYLKKLLEAKLISYSEFDAIDLLNKARFLVIERTQVQKKQVI